MTGNEHHYLPPDLDFYHRQMHESIQHPRGDHDAHRKPRLKRFVVHMLNLRFDPVYAYCM